MKALVLAAMALSFSATVSAADLNTDSLATLLSSKDLSISGDVHSYETFNSIYKDALENKAVMENTCEMTSLNTAECTLMLTYEFGDTALIYSVYMPGNRLVSSRLYVSRGH